MDTSDHAVGAVFTQEKDKVDMLIAYFSKILAHYELNYDKEKRNA